MGNSSDPAGWVTRSERVDNGNTIITFKITLDRSIPLDTRADVSDDAKALLVALLASYNLG